MADSKSLVGGRTGDRSFFAAAWSAAGHRGGGSPGSYTAIVRGVSNGTGIGLVEVYDLDRTVNWKPANISSRGLVQTGNDVITGGSQESGALSSMSGYARTKREY